MILNKKIVEHLSNLDQRLALLPKEKQTAFATVIAKGMIHLYLDCQGDDWCKPETVKKIFEIIWGMVEKKSVLTDSEIHDLVEELLRVCPDMDQCPEFDALDFCSALGFALQTCSSAASSAHAASAAESALENLARRSNCPEEELANDLVIASEMRKQLDLLRSLEQSPTLNSEELKEIR